MRRVVTFAVVICVLAAAAYGADRYLESRLFTETDDAYVGGDLVTVSAQIDGTVVWLGAETGDYVEAGQVLLRLGGTDAGNILEQRQDELALAVQEVAALKQRVLQYEADVERRRAVHRLAEQESRRRDELAGRGMVAVEEQTGAALRVEESGSALEAARQSLAEARIAAGAMPVEEHPRVRRAAARLRKAFIDVRRTLIVAPVSGHVAKRFVSPGMRIEPGRPLLQLVQLDRVWVEANFKETQLRHLRIDQPVEMISDLYGDEVVYRGHVEGTGTGTGSVFSILPPQNATGNWLKVVQRVPVRILFSGDEIEHHKLPLGTSMRVRVDTGDRSGERLKRRPRKGAIASTEVYGYQTDGAEEMVQAIIAEHLTLQHLGRKPQAQNP